MLIGICGGKLSPSPINTKYIHCYVLMYLSTLTTQHSNYLPAICSGKTTTASFLVHEYGFRRLRLVPEQNSPKDETSSDLACVIRSQVPDEEDALTFTNAEELLAFVTRHWRELWVTTDICDEDVLEMLLRRPFFLLIGIESPLGFCWQRYSERYAPAHALEGISAARPIMAKTQQLHVRWRPGP